MHIHEYQFMLKVIWFFFFEPLYIYLYHLVLKIFLSKHFERDVCVQRHVKNLNMSNCRLCKMKIFFSKNSVLDLWQVTECAYIYILVVYFDREDILMLTNKLLRNIRRWGRQKMPSLYNFMINIKIGSCLFEGYMWLILSNAEWWDI